MAIIFFFISLMIYNLVQSNKPILSDSYYEDFQSLYKLELKYSKRGSYKTSKIEYDSDNKNIEKIYAWFPSELQNNNRKYPMIVVVNPSNTKAQNYMIFFDKLASWGFIVIGNDDPQTGNGKTTSITLDYIINKDGILKDKIDTEKIGIIGYSQGGAGAINAITRYDNGKMYKAIFTGSAPYALLSKNLGWEYDISKISYGMGI